MTFRRPKRIEWLLLLSLFFHAMVLWNGARDYKPYHFDDRAPIEITQAPPQAMPRTKAQKRPEIAETEDAKNRKLDPNAAVLSDRNQTAQQQTRAAHTDDFRQKMGTGLKSHSQKATTPATGEASESANGEGAKAAGIKRNWKTLTLKDLGIGGDGAPTAASDDRLSDVARGDRTVLSTREFKFYSYYHRIKETLRQYWKPNVERKLAMLWSKGAKMEDAELVTQVVVLIDEKGKVTRINRLSSSGFEELDSAAIEAFNAASPFPNPPAGMKDPDGLVRLRWDFILKTEASPQITFRGNGARRNLP